jgi:hypothetical protein
MFTLLLTTALAEPLAPGTPIDRALAVHVTNAGLAHMGDAIEGLVPPSFPITDVAGEFACDENDETPLAYTLEDTEVVLTAQNVDMVTRDGWLDIALYITIESTAADLTATGDCTVLTDMDEECELAIPTSLIVVEMSVGMEMVDGFVDATVTDPTVEIAPIGNPLSGDNCLLADAIGTLLLQDDYAISNLILSFIEPELGGLGADLEVTIEDALSGLTLETSFALGEGEIELQLEPTALELSEAGLVLGMGGATIASSFSDCVPSSEGSEFVDTGWPDFNETAWDSSLEYDAGIFINKGYVDHLLWNVWQAGALCIAIDELGGGSLTTELLGNFFGDEWNALFPEPQAVAFQTRPETAPTIIFHHDDPVIGLFIEELGLDVTTELDARYSRLVQVGVTTEVGIDPGISATMVEPALVIDEAGIDFTEPYNELLPPGFSNGLAEFIPTVIGTFIPDDLLPTIAIPSFYGLGLKTVFYIPSEDGEWQGAFVILDIDSVQPLEIEGCSGGISCDGTGEPLDIESMLGCDDAGCGGDGCGGEGCADEGCEGGSCGVHGDAPRFSPIGRWMMLSGVLFGLLLRRRR